MKKNILTNTLINCDQQLYILNYIYILYIYIYEYIFFIMIIYNYYIITIYY